MSGLRATFAFQALPMALSALLALSLREPRAARARSTSNAPAEGRGPTR